MNHVKLGIMGMVAMYMSLIVYMSIMFFLIWIEYSTEVMTINNIVSLMLHAGVDLQLSCSSDDVRLMQHSDK